MKVCLVTCSAPFLIDERVFPPLGLMAVGTALRIQGHDVAIKSSPDNSLYFAVGPTTPEYPSALGVLHQVKRNADARVIIGGPHAAANIQECLGDGFDVVALGDGEIITGDTFTAGGVVNLGRRPLDEYPIIDRSLLDIRSYHYEIDGRATTTVLTSRGCPYQCGFCAKTEDRVRYRSVESIEEEVAYLKNDWGFNALMFFDDTFILNKERALGICEVLRKYGILWRCFVRGDLVIKHGWDLINPMADCGCVEVGIGVESGSNRILKIIHKGEDVNTIRLAVAMLQQAGIRVKGFFIIGLPGENCESLSETRRFLEEVQLDDVDFTIYQPYRGSHIWNNRHSYDIVWNELPADQRFYKGRRGEYECAVRTSSLTPKDIVEAREELERSFAVNKSGIVR